MKKNFFLLSILFISSYGEILSNLNSFSANFIQKIDDKENKIITYKGKMYAKKPQTALWQYLKPIQKDVYINNHTVTVIEPELEQVILRDLQDDFNIFELLRKAQHVDKNKYLAHYKDYTFTLLYDGKNIQKLSYKDNFENLVTIIFSNQQYNKKIDDSFFQPKIPKGYDIIKE